MLQKTLFLSLSVLATGFFLGCKKDCTKPQPDCYSGKIVATTCMMGILVDVDPAYPIGARAVSMMGNRFLGNNVVAVANPANLGRLASVGQQLYFTYTSATTPSPMACLAADGPTTPVPIVSLHNVSATSCDSVRRR